MKLVSTEPPPQLLPPHHETGEYKTRRKKNLLDTKTSKKNPLLNSYHLIMRLVSINPTKRTPPQLLPPQHNPLINSYHFMRLVSTNQQKEPPPQLLSPQHEPGEYKTSKETSFIKTLKQKNTCLKSYHHIS
jgi:hypothetical protein